MIPQDKMFYFSGGQKAASIEELRNILHHIPDPEFDFHLNSGKNDFANWVEGVFQEKDLADEMRRVMEKKDLIALLSRFLHPEQEKAHMEARIRHTESKTKIGVHKELPAFELETGAPPELLEIETPIKDAEEKNDGEKKVVELSIPDIKGFFQSEDELPMPPIPPQKVDAYSKKESLGKAFDGMPMPAGDELKAEEEHSLSEDDIKGIVIETRKGLKKEDANMKQAEKEIFGAKDSADVNPAEFELGLDNEAEDEHKKLAPEVMKQDLEKKSSHAPKFIVKEFIYGFVLGLIFGLIMLGFLFNLKSC